MTAINGRYLKGIIADLAPGFCMNFEFGDELIDHNGFDSSGFGDCIKRYGNEMGEG